MILRVDLTNSSWRYQTLPLEWKLWGGRGLTAQLLSVEVPPTCDPLGPENKLVFAPGLLAGSTVSSSGRVSVGSKSPMTGGIKESNAGGLTAQSLARLGIRALVLEGQAQVSQVLYINRETVELLDATSWCGMGVYEFSRAMLDRFGKEIALACIGPTGEQSLLAAGIANLDGDQNPGRFAARGGLGAVMGSKGLKGIVLDAAGTERPTASDQQRMQQAVRQLTQVLRSAPSTKVYKEYGTPAVVQVANNMGALPTHNFRRGSFTGADRISGETIHQLIKERGGAGANTHRCMPGCLIQCSNSFADAQGQLVVSPLEYETLGMMGSNCGIDDVDVIAQLNYRCNDLGLDTIELGATLGLAMEAGLLAFGDGAGALALLDSIAQGEPLGRLLASGARVMGQALGLQRVPEVKGQALSAYDPRALKGMGVTFATSPMGADHTAGSVLRSPIDHLQAAGQSKVSQAAQIKMAVYDLLGLCMFVAAGLGPQQQLLVDVLNSYCGANFTEESLWQMGNELLELEHKYNREAGLTTPHRLPDFFYTEILPETGTVFDVDLDSFNN